MSIILPEWSALSDKDRANIEGHAGTFAIENLKPLGDSGVNVVDDDTSSMIGMEIYHLIAGIMRRLEVSNGA